MSRGGARPGAGRPPLSGAPRCERLELKMTEAARAEIEAVVPAGEPLGPWIVESALLRARMSTASPRWRTLLQFLRTMFHTA